MNEISTSESLKDLVEAMRDELQQYGEMLARFDDLEKFKIGGPSHERLANALIDQAKVIQATRRQRAETESQLARHLGLPAEVSRAEMVSFVPRDYQPLVQALMDENNELPLRIQQRLAKVINVWGHSHSLSSFFKDSYGSRGQGSGSRSLRCGATCSSLSRVVRRRPHDILG